MTKAIVNAQNGIHARPATQVVQEAMKFTANIQIEKNGVQYNAKSIMSIMSAGLNFGEELTISAVGDDANIAENAIASLIESILE